MPFSEDDLRQALKKKDPGPEFTRRVMARLNEGNRKTPQPLMQRGTFAWFPWLRFGPALATALALVLLISAWIGFSSYQRRQEQQKIAQRAQEEKARQAERQALLALRITSQKLNHVFQKVNGITPQDHRIRRERL